MKQLITLAKALTCGIGFAVLFIFVRHAVDPDPHSLSYEAPLLLGSGLVASLFTGTVACLHEESRSWRRIAIGTISILLCIVVVGGPLALALKPHYLE